MYDGTTDTVTIFDECDGEELSLHTNPLKFANAILLNSVVDVN